MDFFANYRYRSKESAFDDHDVPLLAAAPTLAPVPSKTNE